MKKIFSIIAALCLVASASAAELTMKKIAPSDKHSSPVSRADDQTLVFGYCGGLGGGLGAGSAGAVLEAAIQFPTALATKLNGAEITKIRIGFGVSSNTNVTIFITKSLTGEAFYLQNDKITTQSDWNEITLETPYKIDGSAFYIGYQTVTKNSEDFPIVVDGIATDIRYGDNIGLNNNWDHYGSTYGSVCVQAVITGDNLPQNDVSVCDASIPSFVEQNSEFSTTLAFINQGVQPVSSLSVSCSVNGVAFDNPAVQLTSGPVASGEMGFATVSGLVCAEEGVNLPITLTVDKVNGADDETTSNNSISSTLTCAEKGFKRNVVVEEFTGTWCGWCPRGIVGMSYMKEKYGDSFIGIAAHYNDAMQSSTYLSIINSFSGGSFPGAIVDRKYSFDPDTLTLEQYYLIESQNPTTAGVELSALYTDDNPSVIKVEATTEFSLPSTGSAYRLAFAITENHVGPYSQLNYYSSGQYGPLQGWSGNSSRVETYFNEVARDIFNAFGISGSLPASIEKGEKYTYTTEIPTTHIKYINNCDVIAMVLNVRTNQIVNATKVSMAGSSGVHGVSADNSSIGINPVVGGFEIVGDYSLCTVYGVDGSNVKQVSDESFVELPAGLYIAKVIAADGSICTKKVSVK